MVAGAALAPIVSQATWKAKETIVQEDWMAEICWNSGWKIRTFSVKKSIGSTTFLLLGWGYLSSGGHMLKLPTWGVLEVAKMQCFGARSGHWVSHDDAQQHRSLARKEQSTCFPIFLAALLIHFDWLLSWWTFCRRNFCSSNFGVSNWFHGEIKAWRIHFNITNWRIVGLGRNRAPGLILKLCCCERILHNNSLPRSSWITLS